MYFISTNSTKKAPATAERPDWCYAIENRYGDAARMARAFGIDKQQMCAERIEDALRSGIPSLARMIVTYGQETIESLLSGHLHEALVALGEIKAVDHRDLDYTVRGICSYGPFRTISMAGIIGFFYRLKCGEFDIYGQVNPRRILEVMHRYAQNQQELEYRISTRIEQEQRQAEEAARERDLIPWPEVAARHGIDLEKFPRIQDYLVAAFMGQVPKIEFDLYRTPEK